jgi:predicted nuclease of predicted toxin-antitoxin system
MRLLIDACLPQRLRHEFSDHDVFTAGYLGWDALSNGELLAAMMREQFDVLLTADANLPHQQSVATSTVCVIVLRAATNRMRELRPLVTRIQQALAQARPGLTIEVNP